ncbi:MAG: terminase small subunit [Firmicutes bacterium]|nr:terminase small subunit [Bacillota bacterium]
MTNLTPRQQKFVQEFLRTGNATQSAITAGYGSANADVTAARLLKRPLIQSALDAAKKDLHALFMAEAYDSLRTLVAIRDDPDAPASARLRAAQDLLDRAGYKPADRIESTVDIEQHTVDIRSANALLEALGFDPLGTTLPTMTDDALPPKIAGDAW